MPETRRCEHSREGPRMSLPGLDRSSRGDTDQERCRPFEEFPSGVVELGSVPRLGPRFDQWQRPRRRIGEMNQTALRTTPNLIEHVFPPGVAGRTTRVRGGVGSSRKPLAALQPPSLENRASCTGRHSGSKAVLGRSVLLVRLIGTFHVRLLRTWMCPGWARNSKSQFDCNPLGRIGRTNRPTPDENSR